MTPCQVLNNFRRFGIPWIFLYKSLLSSVKVFWTTYILKMDTAFPQNIGNYLSISKNVISQNT